MSMSHKAYVFNYDGFIKGLSGILADSLATNNCDNLVGFIEQNISSLKSPDTWMPLSSSWNASVEPKDPHQYGNVALTKFFDPVGDIGLGYAWDDIDDLLQEELFWKKSIILGDSFGPKDNYFDPGKLGSYFQSFERVLGNLQVLRDLLQSKPSLCPLLNPVEIMLEKPAKLGKGLYVTF